MQKREYGFEFKDETSMYHRIYVEHRPNIPVGKEKIEYIQVAGREDTLAVRYGEREDVEIKLNCAFKTDKDTWHMKIREIRKWLSGSGRLIFSDSQDTFWKVKNASIKEFERTLGKYGTFQAVFTCGPFEYLNAGLEELDAEDISYNSYEMSKPVYKITGNGTCTLTVNGNTMTATVGQNLTIDTDRMLAYREDGTMMNTHVVGDYEDLCLLPGDNDISITTGFGLKVIPNWRYL